MTTTSSRKTVRHLPAKMIEHGQVSIHVVLIIRVRWVLLIAPLLRCCHVLIEQWIFRLTLIIYGIKTHHLNGTEPRMSDWIDMFLTSKSHHQFVDLNSNIHAYNTRRKMDIHNQSYNTDLYKRSVINMGTKLCSKLPSYTKEIDSYIHTYIYFHSSSSIKHICIRKTWNMSIYTVTFA